MITVSLAEDNQTIIMKAHYNYMQRLRQIPGSWFESTTKTWRTSKEWIDEIEILFEGEIYYKTPLWVIKNEPAPDMSKMYQLKRDIAVPQLKLTPFDYQRYGIKFMINCLLDHGFVINADSVGLGKTPQGIGCLKWVVENLNAKKILIIAKKSIKKQWEGEIQKFTDLDTSFPIYRTVDSLSKRNKAYDEIEICTQGVLITNYHNFLNDTAKIAKTKFDLVIIDEAHCVATRSGKIHKNIAKVTSGIRTIFLTGTPVMSKPEDLFGIVQLANPKFFGTWKDFSNQYVVEQLCGRYTQIIGAKNLNELREKTQSILIRRTEYEVSVELPEIMLSRVNCDIDSTQVKLQESIEANKQELSAAYDTAEAYFKKTGLQRYQQEMDKADAKIKGLIAASQAAASDPRMFLMTHSKMMKTLFGSLVPSGYKMSAKTEATLDQIENIVQLGEKVVVFSKFKTSVKLLESDIVGSLNTKVVTYTGDEDDEQRDAAIDEFKNNPNCYVLIGTHAMAEGLNLQFAKFLINYDQPDTLAIKTQRIGRVRRVGSKYEQVLVYDMITLNSKDEERLENIEKNANLEGALVNIDSAQREALIRAMERY